VGHPRFLGRRNQEVAGQGGKRTPRAAVPNAVCRMHPVGSDPTSSARGRTGPPHRRVRHEHRQGKRLAGSTWPPPAAGKE
jgi:hypothetical protein